MSRPHATESSANDTLEAAGRALIDQMRAEGMSIPAIAQKLRVHPQSIRRLLAADGKPTIQRDARWQSTVHYWRPAR